MNLGSLGLVDRSVHIEVLDRLGKGRDDDWAVVNDLEANFSM